MDNAVDSEPSIPSEPDPIRVLVVDDSEFFAEMTAKTLSEEHGFETRFRTSTEEALAALDGAAFDCIVSDYEMPDADGLDLLEAIKRRDDEVPFILLTGRGTEEIASDAIAAGVADYLLKLEVVEDEQYERLANRIRSVVDERRARETYELLVRNSPDAIAHVAADGTVLTANPAFASLVGRGRDAVVGERLPDLLGETGTSRLETGRSVLETGERTRTEDVYDGRHFHNIFVPSTAARDRASFQLISRDITERKEREQELKRQNERLETFAQVVSHDLRNPLNVASSCCEVLDDDGATLARLERSLERMEDLIDDVLTLAKQGQTAHETEVIDVATAAEDAWDQVQTADATLTFEGTRSVEADPSRLRELFENLFANAVEHGGTDVTVRVGSLTVDDGVFYVADDGPGIAEADRSQVFDVGYSTGADGTGMGLSIVSQIASAHDWRVELADAAEGGARFEFYDDH